MFQFELKKNIHIIQLQKNILLIVPVYHKTVFFENMPYFLDHKAHLKSFNFLKNWKCAL